MQAIISGNLIDILHTIGYLGVAFIIFAECGLFFGFFFPGDSLLFTAGLLASQGYFNIYILLPLVIACSILGNMVGYSFGKFVGPMLFTKEDSFFFNKKNITKSKNFYDKHGSKALIIGRFVPVVRTFIPIVAGVGQMNYKKFFAYNVIGALIWAGAVTVSGYFLGSQIKDIDKYLLPITFAIIVISFLPVVYEFWKERRAIQKSF